MPLTAEAIYTMDAPRLVRTAFDLGLGPAWTHLLPYEQCVFSGAGSWNPDSSLADANGVFRRLRERGWQITQRSQYARAQGVLFGRCEAWNARGVMFQIMWATTRERDPETEGSEAMALLRCAVLAAGHDAAPDD